MAHVSHPSLRWIGRGTFGAFPNEPAQKGKHSLPTRTLRAHASLCPHGEPARRNNIFCLHAYIQVTVCRPQTPESIIIIIGAVQCIRRRMRVNLVTPAAVSANHRQSAVRMVVVALLLGTPPRGKLREAEQTLFVYY